MAGKISNAVATQDKNALSKHPKNLQGYIKAMLPEITKALPSVITPERFSRMVLSAISTNPKLGECTPDSFLGAMMTAAQLGVEPNTPLGQAYLIPFYNGRKKCMECQFQLGYKGLIDLAYRSGDVAIIQAHAVHENDTFEYELGLEPKLKHIPARSGRGNPIFYYAVFKTKDGGSGFQVMSVEDVEAHAKKYSKSYGSGPWQTDFDAMAKKTVLKQCLKYAPLKSDFVRAVVADTTTRDMSKGVTSFEDANFIQADFEVAEGIPEEQPQQGVNAQTGGDKLDEEAQEVFA